MSIRSRAISLAIIPLATLIIGWKAGAMWGHDRVEALPQPGATAEGDPEQSVDIGLLWSVWRLLQQEYIEPDQLETRNMILGAVSGMVSAIGDPYTVFMTPKENTDFRDSLSGH